MSVEQAQELHEKRLQYQLQLQAGQVQKVFGRYGLPATVVGGTVSRSSFHFDMRSQVFGGIRRLRDLKGELKKALGVEGIRFLNNSGDLQLQVIRPFEPAVPLLNLLALIPDVPPATAILGLTEDGKPMVHTFSAEPKPNVLISGQADAGKTILLRTIAASLAITSNQAQVQILAINPVSSDRQKHHAQDSNLLPLNYLPHMLTDVAVRQTEITELLLFLVREMKYRMEHTFSVPHIVVMIDQAATVMEHGGRTVVEALQQLAIQGSEAGIHLVLSTRRPDASVFGPHLTTNLQARFIGRLDMHKASEEKTRPHEVEATTLLGEGDFLTASNSRRIRFQAAYINDYDLHMCLSRLYQKRPILLARPLNNLVKLKQKSKNNPSQAQQFSFVDEVVSVG
jgi:S-DNA-T family DNA segregation ATPase FtsK/SpoIIIE